MPDASRGSLNLFRKNLMPVGLASIATHRLLNQCSSSSARQHSKCNSKCLLLKKWMDDREFQIGAVFCLFNFKVWDWVSRANHGSVYPAVSLHGILFRRLMRELSGKLATFSDMMRTMYYPYHGRVLARRPKSCSNWRQLKSDLDKVPGSLKTISLGLRCSDRALCKGMEQHFLLRFNREDCDDVAHVVLWARFAPCP